MFNVPPAVMGVLAALVAIHAIRQAIPDLWDNEVLLRLSFIPGAFTYAVHPAAVMDHLRGLAGQGDAGLRQAQIGRYILASVGFQPWTILSYGLLHADWPHIGLNSVWLLAFGSPVARRLGGWRFLVFLAATTVTGALAHFLAHWVDLEPVIGASAAVSGCMGAALRFMFQPRMALPGRDPMHDPPQSLRGLLRNRRAMAFLVAWFVSNLLFGIGIVSLGSSEATVAWQAHIGGFLCGLFALPLFDRKTSAPQGRDAPPGSDTEPDDGTPPPTFG